MIDTSFFLTHGYQVLRQIIPREELEIVRNHLFSELSSMESLLIDYFSLPSKEVLASFIAELSKDPVTIGKQPDNIQKALSGHFSTQARLSSYMLSIPKHPILRTLFKQIFPNDPMRVHLPPTARFVLPNNQFAAVPPHQDISYNEHMGDFFVLWVPLVSITDQRGGVKIYPSTNQPIQHSIGSQKEGIWLSSVQVKNLQSIHYTMDIGDVLLLNQYIVHQSMPNLSNEVRISVDYRFFQGSSKKHYYDLEEDRVVAPSTCVV